MDELIMLVTQKVGISEQQAKDAVETVLGFLKGQLPAPLAGLLDGLLAGGGQGAGGLEGLLGGEGLEGLLGGEGLEGLLGGEGLEGLLGKK